MGKTQTISASTETARFRVREQLRKLILGGELKPGVRLTQQQIAKRFGVAQSVVRESLLELQFSGLVELVDNLGIFVSQLDSERLLQAYMVREMLEGLAARLCCERASREDVRHLREMVDRIHQLGTSQKDAERGALDRDFHQRMIGISGNVVLQRLTEAYQALGMIVQASRPHEVIRQEHFAIVDAIEQNQPDEAERRARRHVAEARAAIRKQVADEQFVPRWVIG